MTENIKIVIDSNLCKGCGYCIFECPKEVLALSPTVNARGYNVVQTVKLENCIKCRKCEYICPDMAIYLDSED